ncbi:MAG TPA: 5'/3'-nucleotidase SurE [Gammaproteobacteria bacterium]|jgi:5'-nucleotidase|nr:5'/3'-nucleotidase SurE [Acidiferrobacter sp.]MBR41827.1 5'/3'-nucleotidase SurE [Acidiferrobacter sp.]HAA36433.1 5'/3'-nucleotidase SurE [Gammaproteobacteria bacterium]HAF75345.1 5'/3'-nucleotidase SurE [Gammaproteobacteria bacterium]|tara:strand:+ start:1969 stop:2712 length:744 start_codon:yes stop_codon:yes gene_type:complete
MRILISNDDGYLAPGLAALNAAVSSIAETFVIAPDRNRSGASNSLTLTRPLRVSTAHNGFRRLDGTPTDCVHVGLTGLMDPEPDMVIAGINHGANLGDDVLYSGTVAAAMEGRYLGFPAVAISLAGSDVQHFDAAARIALQVLERMQAHPLPRDSILNVNVPDLPFELIKGFRATRLGCRHKSDPVIRAQDPNGREIYWVGPAGEGQDCGEGTDFLAIQEGYVSVTPLQIDLTRHGQLEQLQGWLTA